MLHWGVAANKDEASLAHQSTHLLQCDLVPVNVCGLGLGPLPYPILLVEQMR